MKIPVITNFIDETGVDRIKAIVAKGLQSLKNDPELCKLLPKQEK
jgi:hypothetical protein